MTEFRTWRERAQIKRRMAAVERAVKYLHEGLAGLHGVRRGTAEKRVRESARPMSAAKALVKDWRRRANTLTGCSPSEGTYRTKRGSTAGSPTANDRAALIRTAFAMELGHGWPAGDRAEAA